jgi:hypothetical protein
MGIFLHLFYLFAAREYNFFGVVEGSPRNNGAALSNAKMQVNIYA